MLPAQLLAFSIMAQYRCVSQQCYERDEVTTRRSTLEHEALRNELSREELDASALAEAARRRTLDGIVRARQRAYVARGYSEMSSTDIAHTIAQSPGDMAVLALKMSIVHGQPLENTSALVAVSEALRASRLPVCTASETCADSPLREGICDLSTCACPAPAVGSTPFMSAVELALIERHLQRDHTLLEWGSGASTLHLAPLVRAMFSVEHDQVWCISVACALRSHHLHNVDYRCIPSDDPHFREGEPGLDHRTYARFQQYVDAASMLAERTAGRRFDAVLIDGRSRLPCALRVLPHLHVGSIVFVHDFWSTYRATVLHASPMLHFYELVDAVHHGQSLAVLRPKAAFAGSSWENIVVRSGGLADRLLHDPHAS